MADAASTPLWRLAEIYHAVVYFAPERPRHYTGIGLKGGWMGYFATRAGALGVVPPSVVVAAFYNFKHTLVERALPDAWTYTTPEIACQARLDIFDEAIRRLLGDRVHDDTVAQAAELAREAVHAGVTEGRVLYAAHAARPVPADPHLALFWACAALREYRGDAHNIALAAAEVDGCEAHVLMEALGLVPADQRTYRGWDEQDWLAAQQRLHERGWLDSGFAITAAGRQARSEIERETDRLSVAPLLALGPARTERLGALLTPLVSQIVTGGALPYPNAMGSPAVPELAALQ